MTTRIALIAALALAVSACNNQDPARDTAGREADATAAPAGPGSGREDAAAAATLADADRAALQVIERIDRDAVAAAGEARARIPHGALRDFADALHDFHTRNLEATRRLMEAGVPGEYAAQAARVPVVTGAPVTAEDVASADRTPGASADRAPAGTPDRGAAGTGPAASATAWLDATIALQEDALARIDAALPAATHEAVGRHLRDTRQAIAAHLDTARTLRRAP